MQEASELSKPDEDDFVAGPLEVRLCVLTPWRGIKADQHSQSDIFEWHCTMRGVPGSEFDGGEISIPVPSHGIAK